MLEKPDLPDAKIIACLQTAYGLTVNQVTFLPLGADSNTAVYRVVAMDATPYFLKLRRGPFAEAAVTLPKWLRDQGIPQIIAPLATQTGQLWASLDTFTVILYPFVAGQNAYEVALTAAHWREFGVVLQRIHTAAIPPAIRQGIQQETYTPLWRESVHASLQRADTERFDEPIAKQTATLMQAKRAEIRDLVALTDRLAQRLQMQSPEYIVCHADLHAGNFLIEPNGTLHIVDWDTLILAPKERDLMYVGGGLAGGWHMPQVEATLFYQGYGATQLDPVALAYYRYERIVQDIAIYCEELLAGKGSAEDRAQSLYYLASNFQPDSVLEIAYQADQSSQ